MSTDQTTRNKATLTRFQQALSSGDWALITNTIDETVEPDALIRTPLPIDATGAELLKQLSHDCIAPSPTCTRRSRT